MALVKKITKVGNSYGVIIPSDIMDLIGLKPNAEVEITLEKGGLFIHPTLEEDQLVMEQFSQFVKSYDETLKKLAH